MRLNLLAWIAALVAAGGTVPGCTRSNPGFDGDSGSAADTIGPVDETGIYDDSSEAESVGVTSSTAPETDTSANSGTDSGGSDEGGDLPLPDCAEGSQWFAIELLEDNFVYLGAQDQLGCILDSEDASVGESGDTQLDEHGPVGVDCADLNFGVRDQHWLSTAPGMRTGLLGRVDLEGLTARGIVVNAAHYKFAVPHSNVLGEVVMSLAPIRDDEWNWWAGLGDGDQTLEEESSYLHRSYPDTWSGDGAFSAVDLSALIEGQWLEGDGTVQIEVPQGRVQAWLDQDGRFDPGFMLWADVVEPFSFYVGAQEGPNPPALWIDACYQ